ncbi:MAG: 2-phospho-L-lactate transferase [Candidatus Odinarchaeia archaeon]
MNTLITLLAGGVGASKFIQGLIKIVPSNKVKIIVNTGDDIILHGLHISPDLDIIMYTLAGVIDHAKGWGVKGDTFNFLNMMKKYGEEIWFNIGDMDLATHIMRTKLIREGYRLTEVTKILCSKLNISAEILPMTDDPFFTVIVSDSEEMHFEEYFVKYKCSKSVSNIIFKGKEEAKPTKEVLNAITSADKIIICPSNPIVSIGTILSLPGVRDALKNTSAKIGAISPIIGGKPVKGPADKFMAALDVEPTAYGVAELYSDFLDLLVIDTSDRHLKKRIENLGIKVAVTNILMTTLEDKVHLAKFVLTNLEEETY